MANNTSIEEYRNRYRAVLVEGGYHPQRLKERCKIRMMITMSKPSPKAWVAAAEAILSEDQFEGDEEGYMGTGMSESTYFAALGSGEFL